jgi:hypothetical protein
MQGLDGQDRRSLWVFHLRQDVRWRGKFQKTNSKSQTNQKHQIPNPEPSGPGFEFGAWFLEFVWILLFEI